MSVAILPISSEYHLIDGMKGEIASSVSIGYGLAIIPCGILLSTYSPKKIMAFGVGLWSLATFGTPFAASLIQSLPVATAGAGSFAVENLTPLLAVRAVMGAAESVVVPTVQTILAKWVPANRKSIATAIVFSGFQMGTVCAYLVSPWALENLDGGWKGMFYLYGLVGIFWLVPWLAFAKDKPDAVVIGDTGGELLGLGDDVGSIVDVDVNVDVDGDANVDVDVKLISQGNQVVRTDQMPNLIDAMTDTGNDITNKSNFLQETIGILQETPWSQFAQSKAVWGMTIAHAASNWGLYNFLSWTPTFYAEQYGLNVKDSALLSIVPCIAGGTFGLVAGYVADRIISNAILTDDAEEIDRRVTLVRKSFQGVALFGPAACLLTLSSNLPNEPLVAQTLLTGMVGLKAFNAAGYGAGAQDKAGERWAALLYGLTSLPGVLFGSLGVYVTGQILDATGQDWSICFGINGVVDIIGGLAFVSLYNSKREFD